MSGAGTVAPLAVVALGLLLVACDEDGPGDRVEASGAGGGSGGASGNGGEGGDAGGSGGHAGGTSPWPENVRVFGSCDPAEVLPTCQEEFSFSCERLDGVGYYVRRDCAAENRGCDFGTNRCVDVAGQTPCEEGCVPGERRCAPGSLVYFECVSGPVPGFPPEAAHCPGYVPIEACPSGTVCSGGACIDACVRHACDCPASLDPACAANGRTYWNACYRDCAGQAPGDACSLPSWSEVWRTSHFAFGIIPTGAGRYVSNAQPPAGQQTPAPGYEYVIEPLPIGPSSQARVEWEGPTGWVEGGQLLELPDGRVLSRTYDFDTYWSIPSGPGLELVASFPANDGFAAFAKSAVVVGDRVWIQLPGRLLYLELDDLTKLHAASAPHDLYEEDVEGGAAWGRLAGEPTPTLLTTGGDRLTLWSVDFETGRRSFRLRFPAEAENFAFGATAFDPSSGGFWTQAIRFDGVLNGVLRDYAIDGDCAVVRSEFERPQPAMFHGGLAAAGDVDGDGDQEVVWAAGSEAFVLDRDEGGWWTIAARIPTPLTAFYRPAVFDLDADGRREIWLFVSPNPGQPYGVVYRRDEAP